MAKFREGVRMPTNSGLNPVMQGLGGGSMRPMGVPGTVPPATTNPQTPVGGGDQFWTDEYWKAKGITPDPWSNDFWNARSQLGPAPPNAGLPSGVSRQEDGTLDFDSSIGGQMQKALQGRSAMNGQYYDPATGAYQGMAAGQIWDPQQGKYTTGGGLGSGGGLGTINTSITPRSVYTPLMTQMAVNQAVSDSRLTPQSVAKQFMRPGVSASQSTKYRSAPALAAGFSQGAQQAAGIPLADNIANEQNLMQGQLAKHQEWTGLAQLLLKQLGLQQSVDQSQLGNLSQLMAMLGGIF